MLRPLAPALLAVGLPCMAPAQGWELVWSDEFDGPAIDAARWTHEVNAWGGGNNELQYYTARPENSRIEDGALVIEARKETFTGPEGTRQYTSARLNSRYKGDWLYGRFEARARVPGGQGLWPAIWMLPTDFHYGPWAASGEIDIMEVRGDRPTTLYNTIHHGGPWPGNTYTGHETETVDLTADFHVYALEWEPDEIRWYLDGVETYRLSDWYSTAGAYPAPFDRRFHLLLNVAVGGNFLPDPPANADYFPRRMTIDYVRVYQRPGPVQQPFNAVPATIPGRVEAEEFDLGGPAVAYSDTTAENIGGAFRPDEGVDLGASNDTDGTPSIGWNGGGEWTEYQVDVQSGGTYEVRIRHAADVESSTVSLAVLDQQGATVATANRVVPGTGGWTSWATDAGLRIDLPSGVVTLRVTTPDSPVNLNWMQFELIEVAVSADSWSVQ